MKLFIAYFLHQDHWINKGYQSEKLSALILPKMRFSNSLNQLITLHYFLNHWLIMSHCICSLFFRGWHSSSLSDMIHIILLGNQTPVWMGSIFFLYFWYHKPENLECVESVGSFKSGLKNVFWKVQHCVIISIMTQLFICLTFASLHYFYVIIVQDFVFMGYFACLFDVSVLSVYPVKHFKSLYE